LQSSVPLSEEPERRPSAPESYCEYLTGRSRLGMLYRHYLLYPRLASRLQGRTLDVGCGIGDFLQFRPGTIGVDINPATVDVCLGRGLDACIMKPDQFPFGDASFDSALMDNVLEHIAVPEPLLREVRRVLRPHGRLLVGVPGERGWDRDPDHKVRYDETLLVRTLASCGFAVTEVFHTPLWQSAWLSRRMRQYCIYAMFFSPAS
jgi:SAM-dependent methyltransferase